MVDTAHHWCWFNTNDPDAHGFLRERCGKDSKGKPYFDKVGPKWKETEVLALLDFDRIYAVFGPAINPYGNKATKAKMELEPPQLQEQQASEPVKVFSLQQQQEQEPEDRTHIIPMNTDDLKEEATPATDSETNESTTDQKNQGEDADEFDDLEKVEKF